MEGGGGGREISLQWVEDTLKMKVPWERDCTASGGCSSGCVGNECVVSVASAWRKFVFVLVVQVVVA